MGQRAEVPMPREDLPVRRREEGVEVEEEAQLSESSDEDLQVELRLSQLWVEDAEGK